MDFVYVIRVWDVTGYVNERAIRDINELEGKLKPGQTIEKYKDGFAIVGEYKLGCGCYHAILDKVPFGF